MKSDSGKVVKKKEICVMPENVEDVEWYGSRNIHRIYVDVDEEGVKSMMYWPWDLRKKPCELPSVPVQVAAEQVVKFMKNVKSNTKLCHCKDLITMNPFMGRYGNWDEWQDVIKHSVDTHGFFKERI